METLYIDLNTVKSEDIYTIGYQRDHNVKTLSFTGCEEGVSYILLIGLPPEVVGIDLVNNQWVITNTYTQYAGTFAAQVRKYVGGQWIAHSPVFFLRIYDSLGNGGKIEDVPPNFETKFEEMSKIISTVSKKLANGEFNGKSAYQIAVANGFKGTEQEWLDSIGFEHSQAFIESAKQVRADVEQATKDAQLITNSARQIELNKIGINVLFNLHRTGKLYGVKIWKSAINPTLTCEKTRDNVGLVCEPSTDSNKGRDDYQDIPLFKWQRVNYKRYDDGFAYPVAFEGESNYNDKDNADVGNIYNTFYYKFIDNGDYEELVISDSPNKELGLKPFEEAVRADGTIMPYFIMSAYHASLGSDGLLHSLPNKKCELFMSHGLMIDKFQKKGKGYWGAGSNRYTFAQIMMLIKYGTKDIQSVMDGCISYSVQLKASIQSATKQKYFPILKSDKSKFIVGSTVSVGYGNLSGSNINNDRNIGTMHKYADRCTILRVEDLPDGTNAGVYLDSEPFDTMPVDVSGKQAEIMISSMPWSNGDTDKVIGHHDGQSVKDDKHPFRIQGIEFLNGAYFLASDTVMIFNADYSKDVYLAKRGVAHSKSETTIKNTYTKIGRIPSSSNGQGSDYWVGDITHKDGAWYPSSELSSQLSYKDRLYAGGAATSGTREFLQGGYLRLGSHAGLTFLDCWNGLSWASWAVACAD